MTAFCSPRSRSSSRLFTALHWRWHPPKDNLAAIDIGIRAFGTCAFVMLTAILWIGPLARLDRRFLPLLYNRRHFGVLTFLVALVHVALHAELVSRCRATCRISAPN